jgi:uncharacterized protein (DUF1810 family)
MKKSHRLMGSHSSSTTLPGEATTLDTSTGTVSEEIEPFDLSRFLEAQETDFPIAKEELTKGTKRSCWIWYIFPQMLTNRKSKNCIRYAIPSLRAATKYLDHPVLGPRLIELAEIILIHRSVPIDTIMGWNVDSENFVLR